ncbi:MAG: peptidyl-prolyl cis-trans isomerase [Leptospirillia bacterium]
MRSMPSSQLIVLPVTLLLTCILSLSIPAQAVVIDRVAAVVGNEAITLSELTENWARQQNAPTDPASPTSREALLGRMIDLKLQVQRARELGIAAASGEVERAIAGVMEDKHLPSLAALEAALAEEGRSLEDFRREVRDQITLGRVVQREVYAAIRVTDADISNYYATHPEAFTQPGRVQLRQIHVGSQGLPEADRALAERTVRVLAEEVTGAEAFARAEAALSGSPAISVGDAGTLDVGQLRAELAEAITATPEGGVTPPVTLPTGTAIFLIEKKFPAAPQSLAEVYETARTLATETQVTARLAQWMAELKQATRIEILIADQ